MSRTNIAILVIVLVVVAVLVTTQPKAPLKSVNTTATSNASFFNVGNLLAGIFGKVSAPSPTPSLSSSSTAASQAVATGKPVSQTAGNDLMTMGSLDGTGLVTV